MRALLAVCSLLYGARLRNLPKIRITPPLCFANSLGLDFAVGVELHVQLNLQTKMFCGCSISGLATAPPNSRICAICVGEPGALPRLNEQALEKGVMCALALGCRSIAPKTIFNRKHYFYPDTPKSYQITQDPPLGHDGRVSIKGANIGIRRIHLEEDAGRMIHVPGHSAFVDFNRAGVPLLEIVSDPDLRTAQDVANFCAEVTRMCKSVGGLPRTHDKRSIRCDVNLSMQPRSSNSSKVLVELKNINSLHEIVDAIGFEVSRLTDSFESNAPLAPYETRRWDHKTMTSRFLRGKGSHQEYRFLAEPNIAPVTICDAVVNARRQELARLLHAGGDDSHGIPKQVMDRIRKDEEIEQFFDKCVALQADPVQVAKWLLNDVKSRINSGRVENNPLTSRLFTAVEKSGRFKPPEDRIASLSETTLTPAHLVDVVRLINEKRITPVVAKSLIPILMGGWRGSFHELVVATDLFPICDITIIEDLVQDLIRGAVHRRDTDGTSISESDIHYFMRELKVKTDGRVFPETSRKAIVSILEKNLFDGHKA